MNSKKRHWAVCIGNTYTSYLSFTLVWCELFVFKFSVWLAS